MPTRTFERILLARNPNAAHSSNVTVVPSVDSSRFQELPTPLRISTCTKQTSMHGSIGRMMNFHDRRPSNLALLSQSINIPQTAQLMGVRNGKAMNAFRYLLQNEADVVASAFAEGNLHHQAEISMIRRAVELHREHQLLQLSYRRLLLEQALGVSGNLQRAVNLTTSEDSLHAVQQPFSSSWPNAQDNDKVQESSTEEVSEKGSPTLFETLGNSLRRFDQYVDVSCVEDSNTNVEKLRRTRGGVKEPFPDKLHLMLEVTAKEGLTDIVSFFSHGRAFMVHDIDRFVSDVMPRFFKQTKWNSFSRQLNLYGFCRITSGPDAGGYYHELFLRGRPNLSVHMRRVGVPQGQDRRKFKSQPKVLEPDFYSMTNLNIETPT